MMSPKKMPANRVSDFFGVSHSTAIAMTVRISAMMKTVMSSGFFAVLLRPTSKKAVAVMKNKNRTKYNNSIINSFQKIKKTAI
jgi:hypothetical protein